MIERPLPSEMFDHYRQAPEAKRLIEGAGNLERLRTQDILRRYLPTPPATVLDIGGAAGVHALWLAQQGYSVHLLDPVPLHVEQARAASEAQAPHVLASCSVGDARGVAFPDNVADAILVLGPLYHLVEYGDRLLALREAHRLLKPGGRLFAASISRFASLIDGLARNLVADPQFVSMLRQDLKNGQHRNPSDRTDYFTTTFFHRPEELRRELKEVGFDDIRLLGIEGPAWCLCDFDDWSAPERRALLMDLLRIIEEDSSILGMSAHVLGMAIRSDAVIYTPADD